MTTWIIVALFATAMLGYMSWQYITTTGVGIVDVPHAIFDGTYTPYETARRLAIDAARTWRGDAELSRLFPRAEANDRGDAKVWRAVFTSSSRSGAGYVVDVVGGVVIAAKETVYNSFGAAMPEDSISSDEAIARVRSLPGRGGAVIEGVEAVYNNDDAMWYWGVMTDKGTVSVRMAR